MGVRKIGRPILMKNGANKSIEEKASKTMEQNTINFKAYLNNMIKGANLTTNTLRESIPSNMMRGAEQPVQVSLPTKIGGFAKFSVGIANPFRTYTEIRTTAILN